MLTKPGAQGQLWPEASQSQKVGLTWEGSTEPVDPGLKNWRSGNLAPPIRSNYDQPEGGYALLLIGCILLRP